MHPWGPVPKAVVCLEAARSWLLNCYWAGATDAALSEKRCSEVSQSSEWPLSLGTASLVPWVLFLFSGFWVLLSLTRCSPWPANAHRDTNTAIVVSLLSAGPNRPWVSACCELHTRENANRRVFRVTILTLLNCTPTYQFLGGRVQYSFPYTSGLDWIYTHLP